MLSLLAFLSKPAVDLLQIPNRTTRREIEPLGELSALFHFIDRRVGERHEFAKLIAANDGTSVDKFDRECGQHMRLLG